MKLIVSLLFALLLSSPASAQHIGDLLNDSHTEAMLVRCTPIIRECAHVGDRSYRPIESLPDDMQWELGGMCSKAQSLFNDLKGSQPGAPERIRVAAQSSQILWKVADSAERRRLIADCRAFLR